MFKRPTWLSACLLYCQEWRGHVGGIFTTLSIIMFTHHIFRTALSNVLPSCVLDSMYPKLPGKKQGYTESSDSYLQYIVSRGFPTFLTTGTRHELNQTNNWWKRLDDETMKCHLTRFSKDIRRLKMTAYRNKRWGNRSFEVDIV